MTLLDTTKERRARYLELLDNDALRAQLAALAEEHETLTVSHTIKAANLALLVEKVLDYVTAIDRCEENGHDGGDVFEAGQAYDALLDLARSLENKP